MGLFANEFKFDQLKNNLQPTIAVSYFRRAFSISNKVRITIDCQLRGDVAGWDLRACGRSPISNSDWAIVEVKYPYNMMPKLAWKILEQSTLKRTSSSKFLMAKRLLSSSKWQDQ